VELLPTNFTTSDADKDGDMVSELTKAEQQTKVVDSNKSSYLEQKYTIDEIEDSSAPTTEITPSDGNINKNNPINKFAESSNSSIFKRTISYPFSIYWFLIMNLASFVFLLVFGNLQYYAAQPTSTETSGTEPLEAIPNGTTVVVEWLLALTMTLYYVPFVWDLNDISWSQVRFFMIPLVTDLSGENDQNFLDVEDEDEERQHAKLRQQQTAIDDADNIDPSTTQNLSASQEDVR